MGTHEKQLSPTVLLIQESNEFKLANAPVTSVEFKSTRREFNQNYVYYELFTGLVFFLNKTKNSTACCPHLEGI